MREFRFHREADQELTEAREWYEVRSEVAAQAFALAIAHAIDLQLLHHVPEHVRVGLAIPVGGQREGGDEPLGGDVGDRRDLRTLQTRTGNS